MDAKRANANAAFPAFALAACLIGTLLLGLSGCASPNTNRTPVYLVFWNADGDKGQGLYIYVTHRVLQDTDKAELRLSIWNHTGRDIFLARIGEYSGTGLRYEIRSERGARAAGSPPFLVGPVAPFDLIVSTPFSGEEDVLDRPMAVYVRERIPSFAGSSAYVDVTVEFPLHYYAVGATSPVSIEASKTLRLRHNQPRAEGEVAPPEDDREKAAP